MVWIQQHLQTLLATHKHLMQHAIVETKPQTTKINARGILALFSSKPEQMTEVEALCSAAVHPVIIRSM